MKITERSVLFWQGTDIYSNFYYSPFIHNKKLFRWSEQAIMYRKAMLFNAPQIAQKILRAKTPMECKKLGRSKEIKFNENVWVHERENIYYEVLLDKFSLPQLRKEILSTDQKTFIEASPFDKIWGVGMDENHPDVENSDKWKGLNLLGVVLDRVRDTLSN